MVGICLGLRYLGYSVHFHTRLVNQFPGFIQFDKPTISLTSVFTLNGKASIIVNVSSSQITIGSFDDGIGIIIAHAAIAPLPVETHLGLHRLARHH